MTWAYELAARALLPGRTPWASAPPQWHFAVVAATERRQGESGIAPAGGVRTARHVAATSAPASGQPREDEQPLTQLASRSACSSEAASMMPSLGQDPPSPSSMRRA